MAKAKRTAPKRTPRDADIPDDMEELNAGRVAGWFVAAEGNSFRGIIRDSFKVKGKFGDKKVFKVLITQGETDILTAEQGETTAGPGTLIGVDEKGWLKGLSDVAEGTEVFVKCMGKDEPTKEFPRGVWKFKLGVLKTQRDERSQPANDDDVPF